MVDSTTSVHFIAVDFDPFAGPDVVRLAPTTEPQVEIWTACLLGGDDANRAYNESVSLRFSGLLNKSALERAWRALVERHEMLRTAFSADGTQFFVFRDVPADLIWLDCSGETEAAQERVVADYIKQDALYVFDLLRGPLVRAGLITLSDTAHHLTITAHHIVCDGWSLGILMQDLSAFYSAYARQIRPVLPDAPLFSQHAVSQRAFAHTVEYQQTEQFWIDQYRQSAPVLDLPTDFPRPALRTYKSDRRDYGLDETLVKAVTAMGVKAGCSFVTTLLASFEVLLHRLTGQEDIVLGLPAAGQLATDNQRLVGHCVNLLPLRSFPKPDLGFLSYLKQRKEAVLDAFEHQQLTFGRLIQKIRVPRDPSRVTLVPVIFNVDIGFADYVAFHGLDYVFISNPRQYEAVDLFLNIGGSQKALTLEWSYNTQLFCAETIDRMMVEFERLLRAVVADPAVRLDRISLADQREQPTQLDDWNSTQAEYPRDTPLHQLLAQTASRYPNKTALIVNDERMSFRELDETANRVAHYLQQDGVGVGDVVGVMLDRSPNLLVSLIAVLKAGAAYVPIDPDYPHDRIAFMLTDSAARRLITSEKYGGRLAHQTKELLIGKVLSESANAPTHVPDRFVASNDLAYILYTSGSTGQPKGVMIEHRNLVNLLFSMIDWPGITSDDVLLGVTTVSFDIAGLELFLPLLTGATLVLADATTAKDGRALLERLSDRRTGSESTTIIQATPATYKMLLASGWEERLPLKILCCGEPMSNDLARQLIPRCDTLWNMYGPTETTIYSTGTQITDPDERITIGRPIHNTQVYIVDEQLNRLPVGTVGEIYIAGDGVARGYWNRPELTAERFVRNPFGPKPGVMYRTGDLGLFTDTGAIHCLGRIDQQIKIRGYRIEPGEIENTLNAGNDIREAVVMAREDRPGDQRLVAYVVLNSLLNGQAPGSQQPHVTTHVVSPEQVRGWKKRAGETLPDYMVPSDFVVLSAFPLTPNGKIDRKALPKPDQTVHSERGTAPENEEEELLLSIWKNVLGRESISVQDDFFELGGHSLIAVQMMARLEKETGRKLPLAALFEHPSIRKLARLLTIDEKAVNWSSLVPIKPQGNRLPLYIVHGAGLHVMLFNALAANLDPEQPVYGLQAKGLDGQGEPLSSIEAIAAHYVSEVLAQNPNGPYVLAGYSLGGIIAYEMARQFMALGKQIKLLAMFDTYAPQAAIDDPLHSSTFSSSRTLVNKVIHTIELLRQNPRRTIVYKTESVERKFVEHYWRVKDSRKIQDSLSRGLVRLYWRLKFRAEQQHDVFTNLAYKIEMINTQAMLNYQSPPAAVAVELFRAKNQVFFMDDYEFLGWKPFALRGVTVHDIPGDHNSIFASPNDQEFGRVLQRVLDSNEC